MPRGAALLLGFGGWVGVEMYVVFQSRRSSECRDGVSFRALRLEVRRLF